MKISKFILVLIYCLYFSMYNLNSAQTTPLADIERPILIEVDKNNIYVCEDFEIKVFSKKTKKLIQKILHDFIILLAPFLNMTGLLLMISKYIKDPNG